MYLLNRLCLAVFVSVLVIMGAAAAENTVLKSKTIVLYDPATADFKPSPGVPECTTFDTLSGDMAVGSATLMVRMASGCVVPYQWHTPNEELLFLTGSIVAQLLGEMPLTLGNGAYLQLPSGRPHRFRCVSKEDCVMLVIADAGFDIHYVTELGREITPGEALDEAKRFAGEDW
tara:strand:- start:14179 stop:14700 length:522 start_codon:yes stop_codon:yes gene_type:complete